MDLQTSGLPVFFEDETPSFIQQNIREYGSNWIAKTRYDLLQNAKQKNVSLPEDFFEELEGPMVRAAREELRFIEFLRGMNLTQTGGNLGITISKWSELGDFGSAIQSMSPDRTSEDWRRVPGVSFVPVPITHIDFRLDLREQLGWQRQDISPDTTWGENATRSVAEKLESTAITQSDVVVTVNGTQSQAPGLTQFGNRITGSINAAWTDVSARNIVGDSDSDVNTALKLLSDNNYEGDVMLGIPGNWSHVLSEDYDTAGSGRSIQSRIEEIDRIASIEVLNKLPDDEMVAVQATSQVLDLRIIEDISVVNWDLNPYVQQFKALAAMVLRVKGDPDASATGIVHLT